MGRYKKRHLIIILILAFFGVLLTLNAESPSLAYAWAPGEHGFQKIGVHFR